MQALYEGTQAGVGRLAGSPAASKMRMKPLLITAIKALLMMVAAFLLWGSLVALLREIPSSPEGAMRKVWNQLARGDTADVTPQRWLDSLQHQLQADFLLLPALAGLLLGLLAAASGWLRRRDHLAGSLLFAAVMISAIGPGSPFGWGAAVLFTAALLAAASLRRRRPPPAPAAAGVKAG